MIDAGEEVVVGWRIKGVGKRSGASVDLMLYTVGLVREEEIARLRNYTTKAEALKPPGCEE